MLKYMKNSIPDILMCFIMTFALSVTVFTGFYVSASQASDIFVTGAVSLAVTVLMAVTIYNKNSIAAGISIFFVLIVGMAIYSSQILRQNILRDEEGNPFMYYILIVITGVVVYLLSRSRVGNLALFIGGAAASCLVCFLYDTEHYICLIIFICTGIVSQIYRNYMYSVINSRTEKISRSSAILTSVVVSLLIVSLGAGLFYGVVKQLDPPKAELKLITKYMSLEVLDRTGVATSKSIQDPNLKTNQKNDNQSDTSKKNKNQDPSSGGGASSSRIDRDKNNSLKPIKYHVDLPTVLITLGIALAALILLVIGKIIARKIWFSRLMKRDKKEQICGFYRFYLKDFGQMNVKRRICETEVEYADRAAPYLAAFETKGTGIRELTEIFDRVRYGGHEPDNEQLNRYMIFYRNFYRNCKQFLGRFRYIIKFLFL